MWLSLLFTVSDVSENVYRYVSSTVSVSIAIISLQISSPFFALGVTFIKAVHWTRSGADCKVKRRTVVVYITLGNKISLFFFLAHEGKYQILIELLTLNSNM